MQSIVTLHKKKSPPHQKKTQTKIMENPGGISHSSLCYGVKKSPCVVGATQGKYLIRWLGGFYHRA